MNVLLVLSVWSVLVLSSSCSGTGTGGGDHEATTGVYDYPVTMTEDYDYTATFDYYYVTEVYTVRSQGSVIGGSTPALLLGLAALLLSH